MKQHNARFKSRRVAGCALAALTMSVGFLACGDGSQAPLTPRAEYSAEDPGEWSAEAATHAPIAELRESGVYVRVLLRGAGPEHYIEKIGILDEAGRDAVPPRLLNSEPPTNIEALLPRPERSGRYRVYARCNLHDLWVAELILP